MFDVTTADFCEDDRLLLAHTTAGQLFGILFRQLLAAGRDVLLDYRHAAAKRLPKLAGIANERCKRQIRFRTVHCWKSKARATE